MNGSPLSTDQNWLTLGGLDLPADDTGSAVSGWLARTLDGLNLRPDLLDKLNRAIQAAADRDGAPRREAVSAPLRLVVYSSPDHPAVSHNWGFFIIEKFDSLSARSAGPQRTIELYLYREGR